MKYYPQNALEKFEFTTIKDWLTKSCISPMGKLKVDSLTPSSNVNTIQQDLNLTWELFELFTNYSGFPIEGYIYVSPFLNLLAKPGFTAQPEQIVAVRDITKTILQFRKYIQEKEPEDIELLKPLVVNLPFEKSILTMIDKILTPDGYVKNRASSVLAVIRDMQDKTRRDLEREFRKALTKYRSLNYLSDIQESVRHGRRVLAVKAEHKRKVKGVIHDISETGQTAYVEPNGALQLSNELINLEQEERAEIQRILKQLTADLQPHVPKFYAYEDFLGLMDFTRAKAIVTRRLDAKVPTLLQEPTINLRNAYHPILKLQNEKADKYTHPLSISLHKDSRILVISGPNAGGKSVSLKTVGLLQIMLQSGIPVPVDEQSTMGVFNQFFTEIGDDQSIENELSTYSSKLNHMSHFLAEVDANSLFLIDEFGSGTDPSLGGAVAQSILEELNKRRAFGIVTTHYLALKTFANETNGVVNGAMLFDEETLRPLYQLEVGKPGSSYTFAIAQTSGLPTPIINRAKAISSSSQVKLDELLTTTQQSQSELLMQQLELKNKEREFEKKQEELNRLKKKLKQERSNYQFNKKEEELRIQQEVKKRFDEYVKKVKQINNTEKGIQELREGLKNELATTKDILQNKIRNKAKQKAPSKGKIEVGDQVRWLLNKEVGEVLEIKNKNALVALGQLKTSIPLKDLVHASTNIKLNQRKKASNVKSKGNQTSKLDTFNFEIDIRGKRFEEAELILQEFFDKAILTNSNWVRILHGKGSGVLRELTKSLAKQYNATEVSHPHPEEGGDGISIVQF